jgi:hypothetical protein
VALLAALNQVTSSKEIFGDGFFPLKNEFELLESEDLKNHVARACKMYGHKEGCLKSQESKREIPDVPMF